MKESCTWKQNKDSFNESCTLKQWFILPGVEKSHWAWSPYVLVIQGWTKIYRERVLLEYWIICIVSKQDGSGVVEDDMKSNHSPYSTQSNYYYLFLHVLFIQIKKTQKLTINIFAKFIWIWHLLIPLRTNALVGK